MDYRIEEIKAEYDEAICRIIRSVGAEFGAIGEGFGPSDDEVLHMSRHYALETKSIYLIALQNDSVLGGGGISAFNKSTRICELRKLFLLSECRGRGVGKALTQGCLDFARSQGYMQCYLDTVSNMKAAIGLYERFGFRHLQKPLDGTPHNGCDVWMLLDL